MIKDSINDFLIEAGIEERFTSVGLTFDPAETVIKYKNDRIYILIDFSPAHMSIEFKNYQVVKHNFTWVENKLSELTNIIRSGSETIGKSLWFGFTVRKGYDLDTLLEVLGIDRDSFELWARLQ